MTLLDSAWLPSKFRDFGCDRERRVYGESYFYGLMVRNYQRCGVCRRWVRDGIELQAYPGGPWWKVACERCTLQTYRLRELDRLDALEPPSSEKPDLTELFRQWFD